jgi:hypothetical protein
VAINTQLGEGLSTETSCPPKRGRINLEIYKWRHLVQNFLGKLKAFKRIAMRNDKADQSLSVMTRRPSAISRALISAIRAFPFSKASGEVCEDSP